MSSSFTEQELEELYALKDTLYKQYLNVKSKIELAKPIQDLSMIPVLDLEVYQMYQNHEKQHWNEFEHDFRIDRKSYDSLTPEERHTVDCVFAYFLVTDGAVSGNIEERFKEDCRDYQSKQFLISQDHRELTHSNTYGLAISVLKRGKVTSINQLVKDMESSPPVMKKVNFLREVCYNYDVPIWELYFYAACTEGIHFSALFCIIFYLRKQGLLPQFCIANEQISREESLHRDYNLLKFLRAFRDEINRHPESERKAVEEKIKKRCYEILELAVEIEDSFIDYILKKPFRTMTKEKLRNYTRVMADNLLYHAVLDRKYNVKNECDWVDEINVDQKSNFYDMLVTAYRKGSTQINNWEDYVSKEYKDSYSIGTDYLDDL